MSREDSPPSFGGGTITAAPSCPQPFPGFDPLFRGVQSQTSATTTAKPTPREAQAGVTATAKPEDCQQLAGGRARHERRHRTFVETLSASQRVATGQRAAMTV